MAVAGARQPQGQSGLPADSPGGTDSHWDCNFPDSVKDICEARDLSLAQKKRILGRNAVELFGLGNLSEPTAVKAARSRRTREDSREAAALPGALR